MAGALHVWDVRHVAGGSQLVQHGDMRPKRARWLIAPLMPVIVRRQLRDCGRWLKQALEQDEEKESR
jgi:predicted ATPase